LTQWIDASVNTHMYGVGNSSSHWGGGHPPPPQ
jgi:hypothetical protein